MASLSLSLSRSFPLFPSLFFLFFSFSLSLSYLPMCLQLPVCLPAYPSISLCNLFI